MMLIANTVGFINNDYADTFQLDCSVQGYDAGCADFLKDERRTKLRLLWKTMYKWSLEISNRGQGYVKVLQDIQTEGKCCGFDPPYSCWFGDAKDTHVMEFLNLTDSQDDKPPNCALEKYYYPSSMNCEYPDAKDSNGIGIMHCATASHRPPPLPSSYRHHVCIILCHC
uniref:Uncharacterized protein n=1 Tax=Mucochytrium quahogii TaxID=96639 RepID=A0A7S2RJD1_9STRA|mmetsp:Transcript_11778/g.18770  ORF Transcript_11778/g.18770 Transcript_11778/m.18770 type:complete len:169 (-) Transcript_11778:1007-1513(-)